jgi:hypothetical protein
LRMRPRSSLRVAEAPRMAPPLACVVPAKSNTVHLV